MRLPLGGCVVTGIISLSSAGVWAGDTKTPFPPCTTPPAEADVKVAKQAFQLGQGSFNEADYATAITYWRDAYRRDCTAHALLLNLARAYELKNDRSEAVNALETYLQRKPDAADADQIRRRIDNLKAQLAPAAPAPVVAAPAPVVAAPAPVAAPVQSDAGEKHGPGATPFIVAGAGGAIAIVGTVLLVTGLKNEDDANNACPSRKNCSQDTTDQGNTARVQEKIGGVMLGVGGAALVGGLIWYFAAGSSGSSQGTSGKAASIVAPSVAPGFAGVSFSGRF